MKTQILKTVQQTDKRIQQYFLQCKHYNFTQLDLLFKWAPLATLFILDALDEQKKDQMEQHLLDLAAAYVLLNAAVWPMKLIFRRRRPNGKSKSFPSRHTAIAFLGSEMLRQEYQDKYPAGCYSGYLISAATAVLRLYHNKHWLSDVLAGAVIGVASAKLSPKLIDKVITQINVQPAVY